MSRLRVHQLIRASGLLMILLTVVAAVTASAQGTAERESPIPLYRELRHMVTVAGSRQFERVRGIVQPGEKLSVAIRFRLPQDAENIVITDSPPKGTDVRFTPASVGLSPVLIRLFQWLGMQPLDDSQTLKALGVTTSDGKVRFEFPHLTKGRYQVSYLLTAPDHGGSPFGVITLRANANGETITARAGEGQVLPVGQPVGLSIGSGRPPAGTQVHTLGGTPENLANVWALLTNPTTHPIKGRLSSSLVSPDGSRKSLGRQVVELAPREAHVSIIRLPAGSEKAAAKVECVFASDEMYVTAARSIGSLRPRQMIQVLGQDSYIAGSKAAIRVIALDEYDLTPLPDAKVRIALAPENETPREVLTGITNAVGTIDATFRIPETPGDYQLSLNITSPLGTETVERSIKVKDAARVLLTTDKPLYQPNQVVHIRALALRQPSLEAYANKPLTLEIEDAKGNKVFKKTDKTNEFGIFASDFQLADELNMGTWKIRAVADESQAEKSIEVKRYVLPKFKVEITTDRDYYYPKETVNGTVQCDYFFGKPVSDANVEISLATFVTEFEEFARVKGRTDKNGTFEFEVQLPDYLVGQPLEKGNATVAIQATVQDRAEHKEQKSHTIVVSDQPINVVAIPESGTLVPGIENFVFIATICPDGSPAQTQLQILVSEKNQERQIQAETDEMGIARVAITPSGNEVTLTIRARDARGQEGVHKRTLEAAAKGDAVLLRTGSALARVGEPLDVEILTTARTGTAYLDIIKDRQTLLTKSISIKGGLGRTTVNLTADMSGTIELHAYKIARTQDIVRDTKAVYVAPASDLLITIEPDKNTYKPGEPATVGFQVTDSAGHPVLAALGVNIVDESVFALQDVQPGLLKVYFTLEKELMNPKYEIHGYDMPAIVKAGKPTSEQAARREKAAEVLMAGAAQIADYSLVVNTRAKRLARAQAQAQRIANIISHQYFREKRNERDEYFRRHESYPLADLGVTYLVDAGYLKKDDVFDPWGGMYAIRMSTNQWGDVLGRVVSPGPDGTADSRDDIIAEFNTYLWNVLTDSATKMMQSSFAAVWGEGDGTGPVRGGLPFVASSFLKRAMAGEEPVMAQMAVPVAGPRGPGGAMAMDERGAAGEMAMGKGGPPPAASATQPPRREVRTRQYFPESLYVNPAVITDENGKATVDLQMADSITTWRLTALASSRNGLLGSATQAMRCFQDFFIDIDLPIALTQHDEVSIPVAVYNYLRGTQRVRLEVEKQPWFELMDEAVKTLTIKPENVDVVYFRVKALQIGTHKLTVRGDGTHMSDAISRDITIEPDGKRFRENISGRLDGNVSRVITIPKDAIAGTGRIWVKIYPGIFASVIEGLESVLRMPSGCFEQTTAMTYPNALVMDYMNETQQITPEIQMKAEQYINVGYQRLLSYEVPGGGFEWFGNAPANRVLTALGILEFNDMARVYEVDPAVITRTQEWLVGQQNADGSWSPDESYLHADAWSTIQNSNLLVSAYITWALAESNYTGPALNAAVNYIKQNIGDATDPYVLALCAQALAWAGQDATAVFDRLVAQVVEDEMTAHWESKTTSVTYSHGDSANIETSALAALAMMRAHTHGPLVSKVLTYLIEARDSYGTWNSTQATILAMKCLLTSLRAQVQRVNAEVSVRINDQVAEGLAITPDDYEVVRQVDLTKGVKAGDNKVEIGIHGEGATLYQIVSQYYRPWQEKPETAKGPMSIEVQYDKKRLKTDDLLTCRVTARLNGAATANMVILDVGIPPGFEVQTPDLEEYVGKQIQKFTISGRQIIFYIEKLSADKPLQLQYRLRAKYPVRAKTPRSRIYEYYNPDVDAFAQPQELLVEG